MLCSNGHNNLSDVAICTTCGTNTFQNQVLAVRQKYNGMAIASMVLGIVWVYWIGSILAVIFGFIAKRQIKERGEQGSGMATAGLVLGWVGVGILVIVLIVGAIAASQTPNY